MVIYRKGANHLEKREAGDFSIFGLIVLVGNQTANRRVEISVNTVWKRILDQLIYMGVVYT